MDETTPTTTTAPSASTDAVHEGQLLEDELLVEEISIDGMCGVY